MANHPLTGKYTWPNPTSTDANNKEILDIVVGNTPDPTTGLLPLTGTWTNHVMYNAFSKKKFIMPPFKVNGTVIPPIWNQTNHNRYLIQLAGADQVYDPDGEGMGIPDFRATQATMEGYTPHPLGTPTKITGQVAEAQDIAGNGIDIPDQKPTVWTR